MRSLNLAQTICKALDNERALDLQYLTSLAESERSAGWVPAYKVMKQVSIRRRLGRLYVPAVILGLVAVYSYQAISVALALCCALVPRRRDPCRNWLVLTTEVNAPLVHDAMARSPDGPAGDFRHASFAELARDLGMRWFVVAMLTVLAVHAVILLKRRGRRVDLIFHSRDSMFLAMLCIHAIRSEGGRYWTDDHYQRWSFLLSHLAPSMNVVQHGFLDTNIPFPHNFGIIDLLLVRDISFVTQFEKYFTVRRAITFERSQFHSTHSWSKDVLLLASSSPHIAEEIEFIRQWRQRSTLPVVVKFHPAHRYDQRKEQLAKLADHICSSTDFPECRVFVSHSSFMEYDYRDSGAYTFSILKSGGANRTADAVLACLESQS